MKISSVKDRQKVEPFWVNEETLSQLLGLTADQIRAFRLNSDSGWIEGLHFARPSLRSVVYNPHLIHDWLVNRNDPRTHQRAVELFLAALPSNAAKRHR